MIRQENFQNVLIATRILWILFFVDVLAALNISHVDWMVLDVEGKEPEILQSFPWQSVFVDLIQVEVIQGNYYNSENVKFFKHFLEKQGYQEQDSLRIDMLFRSKTSNLVDQSAGFKFGTANQIEIFIRMISRFFQDLNWSGK